MGPTASDAWKQTANRPTTASRESMAVAVCKRSRRMAREAAARTVHPGIHSRRFRRALVSRHLKKRRFGCDGRKKRTQARAAECREDIDRHVSFRIAFAREHFDN